METTYPIGCKVLVEDVYSTFEGTYLGDTKAGLARVRDDDTGDIMVGSVDFVEVIG